MNIFPINNTRTEINFKSSFRRYSPLENPEFKYYGKQIIRTSSNILREDINWKEFLQYAIHHFKDKSVINAYSLACSDLSEAYSYKIAIIEEVPKELHKKFLNIKASDIDKEILNTAKSGRINIFGVEFAEILRRYNYDLTKYFKNPKVSVMVKGDDISESDTIFSYEPIKELKENLIINRSDILTELNKLNDEHNSIVLCRNVFPYLNFEYQEKVIQTAKNKLKSGSILAIGNYDAEVRKIDEKLLQNEFFRPINSEECKLIFERK